jgi:hypothetical protein
MISARRSSIIFIRLTLFFTFFSFLAINQIAHFGTATGLHLTALLWSTLVLCLPFFGGGILFYPFAPIVGFYAEYVWEAAAWLMSIVLNAYTLWMCPQLYVKTSPTHLLGWILTHPRTHGWYIAACFLPVVAAWLYNTYQIPRQRLLYYHLRLGLIVLAFFVFSATCLHDLIIISNIHG